MDKIIQIANQLTQIREAQKINISNKPNKELEKSIKELFNQVIPNYIIDEENREVFNQVYYYFAKDIRFNGDLAKGILIFGPVGSGKSSLMDVYFFSKIRPFKRRDAKQLPRKFMDTSIGVKVFDEYCKSHKNGSENYYPDFYFDDLGVEQNAKNFGNEMNVMAEILQDRYEIFRKYGARTHATTNLTTEELKEKYGDRVLSRLYEMCNFIQLGKKIDRRKETVFTPEQQKELLKKANKK